MHAIKSKSLKTLGAACIFAMLALGGEVSVVHAQTPARAGNATVSPELRVTEFYKWYLSFSMQDKIPLIDGKATLAKYVSASLLRQIDKKMHSADGMDEDYFLKVQDYPKDWMEHIAISKSSISGATARATVTLGLNKAEQGHLQVTLLQESGLWKISKVQGL